MENNDLLNVDIQEISNLPFGITEEELEEQEEIISEVEDDTNKGE